MGLRDWANELRSVVGLGPEDEEPLADRRHCARCDFIGRDVAIRSRKIQAVLHLKDVSRKGAAGISDTPFAVGATVFIQLQKPRFFAAEVRWVRNFMIGLEFYRPLEPELVERLHSAHLASRNERAHEEAAMWAAFALDEPTQSAS